MNLETALEIMSNPILSYALTKREFQALKVILKAAESKLDDLKGGDAPVDAKLSF